MKTIARITKSEAELGALLALGYSKKEVAMKTRRGIGTINKIASTLYQKTGCHNLADITRKMIGRYSGIDTEELLVRAMHDSLYALPVVALALCLFFMGQDGLLKEFLAFAERVKTALVGLF